MERERFPLIVDQSTGLLAFMKWLQGKKEALFQVLNFLRLSSVDRSVSVIGSIDRRMSISLSPRECMSEERGTRTRSQGKGLKAVSAGSAKEALPSIHPSIQSEKKRRKKFKLFVRILYHNLF
mmetsp:Transcript_1739/g.3598  ORF Transcript_1739/g.3598 Transcript_1739/m.3598 type:complete len:123 (-) Transcript_1739:369-737(-)